MAKPLRDAIIAPTRIYVKPVLALMQQLPIKGMAHHRRRHHRKHPRVLPAKTPWRRSTPAAGALPKLFQWLQAQGNVDMQEMYRTFNCGIGMVVIVAAEHAEQTAAVLSAQGKPCRALA